MDEQQMLAAYLGLTSRGRTTHSSFKAALRDARSATGRDPDSGRILYEEQTGSWLGAIGYLCLLDQVGSAVRVGEPGEDSGTKTAGILQALESFTTLVPPEREAVYALRNALAHDYSLINQSPAHPGRQHVFRLERSEGTLVQLPKTLWDGNWSVDGAVETLVSMRELGDLGEMVAQQVLAEYKDGRLHIALKGGPAEMALRYFLYVH